MAAHRTKGRNARGQTIKSLRKAKKPRDVAAICEKCGQPHVTSKGKPSCVAHHRNEDGTLRPCKKAPRPGSTVCSTPSHGGSMPSGPAHPNWKTGQYSSALPTRYKHAFELALSDPELTSMKYQLALLDAREQELIKRLSGAEHGAAWRTLQLQVGALLASLNDLQDPKGTPKSQQAARDRQASVVAAMYKTVQEATADEKQWGELYEIAEARRKIAETERRREEGMRAYMTLDEMSQVAVFLAGLLRRYMPDAKTLRSASGELAQFFALFQGAGSGNGDGSVIDVPVLADSKALPPPPQELNGMAMGLGNREKVPVTERGRATTAKKR